MSTTTLGIDLSTEDHKTGAVSIEWQLGTATASMIPGPLDDLAIMNAIAAADRAAVDVPFGWPRTFVTAVGKHRSRVPWPVGTPRSLLRLRLTDVRVKNLTGVTPLSVSSDRLGATAMRWAELETKLRRSGIATVDRTGCTGKVAEVYPMTALVQWGWYADPRVMVLKPKNGSRASYKTGTHAHHLRRRFLAHLQLDAPWLQLNKTLMSELLKSDDVFDALIAALMARAVDSNLTLRPTAAEMNQAAAEGWIHILAPTITPAANLATPASYGRHYSFGGLCSPHIPACAISPHSTG